MKYLVLVFALSTFFFASAQKNGKPNVVFVFADQWRSEATGYAGNVDIKTPNLDKLATQGVTFKNAVSTMPVCTPYRAMMLTGQYVLKNCMFMNDVLLDPDSESFGKQFKKNGYNTAYIGKWHLDGNGRSAFIPKEKRQGWEYWKVLECTHNYNNSSYWGNDDKLHKWEGYDAEAQTKDAVAYIDEYSKKDGPFCLMLSWGPPHDPYETAPKEFQDMYANVDIQVRPNVPDDQAETAIKKIKGYYAHCTALDSYIKDLQDALKRNNIEDNTIFVFTSDHGAMLHSQGQVKKQKIFNESALVPFIIKYPALFGEKGTETDFLINTMDILPTMMGMAGLNVPEIFDGEDITDVLTGKKKDDREAALVSCVQPFGEWKRANGGREYRGLITKKYTYARDLEGEWMLFDNVADPYQLKNLKEEQAYQAVIAELDKILAKELKRLDDEFLTGSTYLEKCNIEVDEGGTVPYKN